MIGIQTSCLRCTVMLLALVISVGSPLGLRADQKQKTDAPQAKSSKGKKVAPAKIVVNFKIDDAPKEARVFVQHIGGRGVIGTHGTTHNRWSPVKNGGSLTLDDLGSGKYQVARYHQLDVAAAGQGRMHIGVFVDRHQFTLKYGETKRVDFVREGGQQLRGLVQGLKETKLDRAAIFVCSENLKEFGQRSNLDVVIHSASLCKPDGAFKTDPLPPGKYQVVVEAYPEIPQSALLSSGRQGPRYVSVQPIEIKAQEKHAPLEIKLRDLMPN